MDAYKGDKRVAQYWADSISIVNLDTIYSADWKTLCDTYMYFLIHNCVGTTRTANGFFVNIH